MKMKKLQMNRVTLGTVENRNSKIACCSFKFCVVFRRLHLSVFQICLQVRLVVSYILTLSKAAVGLNFFPPVTTNRVASMATAQPYASPGDGIAGPACHSMQGCIFLTENQNHSEMSSNFRNFSGFCANMFDYFTQDNTIPL